MSTEPEEHEVEEVEDDDDAGEPEEVEHNSVEEFDDAVEDAIYGGG